MLPWMPARRFRQFDRLRQAHACLRCGPKLFLVGGRRRALLAGSRRVVLQLCLWVSPLGFAAVPGRTAGVLLCLPIASGWLLAAGHEAL